MPVAGQQKCDTIFWSATKKLSWGDYQNITDSSLSSTTQSIIKIGYNVTQPDNYAWVKTSTFFLPCRSYSRNSQTDAMLQHEQLHFDIAEYYRRSFAKRVAEISAASDIFPAAVKALFRDISDKRKAMENDYDKDTNKGVNAVQQQNWNKKLTDLLFETEMYAEPIVKIKN